MSGRVKQGEGKTRRLNLRFHPAVVDKIHFLSSVKGLSRSDVITEAVNRWYRSARKEVTDVPDHPGV